MQTKNKPVHSADRQENIILALILSLCLIIVIFASGRVYKTPDTTTSHIVKPGDTLWAIAEMYAPNYHTGNVVNKIESLNHIDSYIQPGQVLTVPCEPQIFEATAYTLEDGNGDGYTATMTIPKEGRTIAVDPEVIPYGSRLTINGQPGYIAEDCGGAIKGNRIDIFVTSEAMARAWGRQQVEVVVE